MPDPEADQPDMETLDVEFEAALEAGAYDGPPSPAEQDRDAALLAADTRARLELTLAGLAAQVADANLLLAETRGQLAVVLDRIEANIARLAPFADLLEQAGSLSPLDLIRALRSGS